MTNSKRLFYGSCFALITTAFSFSIRAGILPQLAETFSLSGQQLGFINSMWFLGFPISMILGGIFYHTIGPKRIMQFAFATASDARSAPRDNHVAGAAVQSTWLNYRAKYIGSPARLLSSSRVTN